MPSAMFLVFDLPVDLSVKLPRFEPEPNCGGISNFEVNYAIVGQRRDWIHLERAWEGSVVIAQTNDETQFKSSTRMIQVRVEASYEDIVSEVKFYIAYMKEIPNIPEPTFKPLPPEPDDL